MVTVEVLIADLLLRHNCVIVPSFGGFVAKQVSAKIDYDNGTMLPPSKSLLFNKQLINNDGLIINELAMANDLTFDQANIEVKHLIATWNESLKSGKRVEIDKVGNLYLDAENNVCFEQDRFCNLLLESFGLSKVHFLTEEDVQIVENTIELIERHERVVPSEIKEETVVEAEKNSEENEEEILVPVLEFVKQEEDKTNIFEEPEPIVVEENVVAIGIPKGRKSNAWKYVAAACLLPIAFYSFWLPLNTDVLESGVISLEDFNPFHKDVEGEYTQADYKNGEMKVVNPESLEKSLSELPADVEVYTYKYDDNFFIPIIIPENKEQEVRSEEPSIETEVIKDNVVAVNSMNYIVGCFGKKSNAKRMVKKLQKEGFDAKIADSSGGLYRVSAGTAISDEALNNIAKRAKNLNYPGWVLR
jgi:hypothetical protein